MPPRHQDGQVGKPDSGMMDKLHTRQTPALDLCYYVPFGRYNWYNIIQCNYLGAPGQTIHWNPAVWCLFATSHAITGFIALQILVRTLRTFKSWRTLYFW